MNQIKTTLITSGLLATALLMSTSVHANSSQLVAPCETADSTKNGISLLSSECPVGNGLWASMKPKHENSDFWLQCGVYRKGVSSKNLARIQLRVSEKVSVKLTDKGYQRCLVGPYKAYANALGDMTALRKNKIFKDSFIREVKLSDVAIIEPSVQAVVNPVAAAVVTPAVIPKSEPTVVEPAPQVEVAAEPVVVAVLPVAVKDEPIEEQAVQSTEKLEVRRQAVINGHTYVVPFISGDTESTYMEHEQPWIRESFESATKICQSLDMTLVSKEQWKTLRESKRMEGESWPLQLPYWGENEQGMFMDGFGTKLKGAALLNVVCIK